MQATKAKISLCDQCLHCSYAESINTENTVFILIIVTY